MHKKNIFLLFFLVILVACSENASSPQDLQEYSSANESASVFFSSNSVKNDESSSAEKQIESSSSKKKENKSSSSAKKENSSSSEKTVEPSSSSGKGEKPSSSEGAAGSSSSDVVAESSSSEKSSSSVAESSSSIENSSSEEPSSSSVVESSSNVAESSSSIEDDVSSSSEYYKLSWDYLNPSIPYDTIIDSRDGQVYKVVTIGNQTWMAENLNYYDTIQSPDIKQHSRCLYDDVRYCERYGRLYDSPIAMDYDSTQKGALYDRYKNEEGGYDSLIVVGICPNGWRMPTRSEWLNLSYSCSSVRSANWGGENTCGISVVPSGFRYLLKDSVSFFSTAAYFWTASYNSASQPSVIIFEKTKLSEIFGMFRGCNLSIRCIKDN